jgi:hypothetical protein
MKKSGIAGLLLCMMLGTASVTSAAETNKTKSVAGGNTEQMMSRLREIKSMDLKRMERSEKQELRKEVQQIKKQMKSQEPVLYISLGAALLIVLLLVLLV